MAKQNAAGNYLRIKDGGVNVTSGQIDTECWKDAATRNNPTDFDQPVEKVYDVAGRLDVSAPADASKSVEDNLITAGYLALAQLDELAAFDQDA